MSRPTAFYRSLFEFSDQQFTCFIIPRRWGTTRNLIQICKERLGQTALSEDLTQRNISFIASSRRMAAKCEDTFKKLLGEQLDESQINVILTQIKFYSSSQLRCESTMNEIVIDTIDHEDLVNIWKNVVLPLLESQVAVHSMIAVRNSFSPELAVRLPVWIGILVNRVKFRVKFFGNHREKMSQFTEKIEIYPDVTGTFTNIEFTVCRNYCAGDVAVLVLPNVVQELNLTQDERAMMLWHSVIFNQCLFERTELLYMTLDQFHEFLQKL